MNLRPCSRVESTRMVYYARVVENPVGVCLGVESRLIQQDLRREANARQMVEHFCKGFMADRPPEQEFVDKLVAARSISLGPGILAWILPNAWHETGFVEVGFADSRGVYYVCRTLEVLKRALFEMSRNMMRMDRAQWAFRFQAIDVLCWLEDEFAAFENDTCRFALQHNDADFLQVVVAFLCDASYEMSVSLRVHPGAAIVVMAFAKFAETEVHYLREFKQKEDVVVTMAAVADAVMIIGGWKGRVLDDFRNRWVAFALHGVCFTEAEVLAFLLFEQSFLLPEQYISAWCRLKTPFPMDKRGGAIRAMVLMNERYVFF